MKEVCNSHYRQSRRTDSAEQVWEYVSRFRRPNQARKAEQKQASYAEAKQPQSERPLALAPPDAHDGAVEPVAEGSR